MLVAGAPDSVIGKDWLILRGTTKPRSCRPFLDGIRSEFRGDGGSHYEISGATPAAPPAKPREFLGRVAIEITTTWSRSIFDKEGGGSHKRAIRFFVDTSRIARVAIVATATSAICAFSPKPA